MSGVLETNGTSGWVMWEILVHWREWSGSMIGDIPPQNCHNNGLEAAHDLLSINEKNQ